MEKSRREDILDGVMMVLPDFGGIPEDWLDEIKEIGPDDSFDALDIMVGHMCEPENGGFDFARFVLENSGATSDEAEELVSLNCDMYF